MAIFNSYFDITRGYLDKYGDESQALEALRPQEIQESLGFGEAEWQSPVSCWKQQKRRGFHGVSMGSFYSLQCLPSGNLT